MRKYKKYVLFLFIFINLNNLVVFSQTKPLYGKVIVIDPGHQGIGVSQIWWIAIKPSKYKVTNLKKDCLF